ncbi:hypothetical protein D1AOALGA4SA_8703 [Olavius algarvensis Delta 1 endosymbiont]|nr:hypothetical protein D1AOALGA4SA_8703 [Olavius algarvensis Delta 1 endosymbiont]
MGGSAFRVQRFKGSGLTSEPPKIEYRMANAECRMSNVEGWVRFAQSYFIE